MWKYITYRMCMIFQNTNTIHGKKKCGSVQGANLESVNNKLSILSLLFKI